MARAFSRVRGWPRSLRRAVALVLVVNIALGLAFSVIGLRRQADSRARLELELSSWTANARAVQSEVWRSIAAARATSGLTHADAGAVPATVDGELRDPSTIADVETVVLMLFAAGVGLMLFRADSSWRARDARSSPVIRVSSRTSIRSATAQACFVQLSTGQVHGFEALARWEHPERGTVLPAEFIAIAEQTGLIVELGRTVLRQACTALAQLHMRRPELAHLTVAVNLSARELAEPDLVDVVARTLADADLAAEWLTIEVTESLLVDDADQAIRQLSALRRLGVSIAIDDFGTGYSSLGYLERLPVDVVKIDKSFVDRLVPGQPSVIVDTLTRMAAALGMVTVAERIEHPEQAEHLARIDCDLGQGYLYSRPVPIAQVEAVLAALPVQPGTPVAVPVERPSRAARPSPGAAGGQSPDRAGVA